MIFIHKFLEVENLPGNFSLLTARSLEVNFFCNFYNGFFCNKLMIFRNARELDC